MEQMRTTKNLRIVCVPAEIEPCASIMKVRCITLCVGVWLRAGIHITAESTCPLNILLTNTNLVLLRDYWVAQKSLLYGLKKKKKKELTLKSAVTYYFYWKYRCKSSYTACPKWQIVCMQCVTLQKKKKIPNRVIWIVISKAVWCLLLMWFIRVQKSITLNSQYIIVLYAVCPLQI